MGRAGLRAALAATALSTLGGVALTVVPPVAPSASATTLDASCSDGGGTRWDAKVVWGDAYTVRSTGERRVSVKYAVWTTDRAGGVRTDATVRSIDATGKVIQRLVSTGSHDYREGTVNVGRNPRDPLSLPGRASVTVTLGVDGDGLPGCTVRFLQPRTTVRTPSTAGTTGGTSTATPKGSTSGTAASTGTAAQYEVQILAGTNAQRATTGLLALQRNACLDGYARTQARRMAAGGAFAHQQLGPILASCGLRTAGENIAAGQPTGSAAVTAWMNSTGHRENILRSSFTRIGIGAARSSGGTWYYAQTFGG